MDESIPRPARHRPAPMLPAESSTSQQHDFYRDAAVDELCRLDTFEGAYDSKDFLAGLSDRLIARSRADPGPFNPNPFIRTFETAIQRLQGLRTQLQDQQTTLASSVQVAQSAYSSKLHEIASHFTSVSQSFSSLESRFGEVSRTAITIGEQLENIHRQRQRALEAHDLIEHYYAFARGDTSKLDRLRKEGGREGRLKTAIIARRLGVISREVDVPGAEQIRETVDRYNERFERDMLKLFDRFYRKGDPKMMSHIAKVLQNFNGGQSCVQIYVNQHDFFISKDRVGEATRVESSNIWKTLADPDALPPTTEKNLADLFSEIRQVVEQEAQIIAAVFPNPLMVMTTFLQRVFAQSVQGHIEVLMNKAAEIGGAKASSSDAHSLGGATSPQSDLAFLRVLQMARSMALALIADIKVYDFRGPGGGPSRGDASPSLLADGPFGSSSGNMIESGPHTSNSLSAMLEGAVDEIFMPYMEGTAYLERETKSLTELYAAYLARFTAFHRSSGKIKGAGTTIFDRVRAAAGGSNSPGPSGSASSSSSTVVGSSSSSTAAASAGSNTSAFSKISGFVGRARGAQQPTAAATAAPGPIPGDASQDSTGNASIDAMTPVGGEEDSGLEGDLSLGVAERMLRWHAEAIGRCVDLSKASDVGKNAFSLLKVLAEAFLKSYVETALDSTTILVAAQDTRSAQMPDLSPLRIVRQVDLVTSLWQHYIHVALLPLVSNSVTMRREMAIFNNHNLLRVEGKCDALVQRLVDNLLAHLSGRLATQKKNDFAPKNDEFAMSRMNTDACLACCDALARAASVVHSIFPSPSAAPTMTEGDGGDRGTVSSVPTKNPNAENVLLEVGLAFHAQLLDHFKKFTVTAAGGLMLNQDLAAYQEAASKLQLGPLLADRFDMLRSLGNLFIVQPSVLRGYMKEGNLGKVDEKLLQGFLVRRSDYAKDVRDLALGPALVVDASATNSTAGTGQMGNVADEGDQGRLERMLLDLDRYAAGSVTSEPAAASAS